MRNASGRRRRHETMHHYVGKGSHWTCVLDAEGEVVLSRRVEATEEALEAACEEIAELGVADERVVGIDLTGGPAMLLEAVLLGRGERVRYVPGTAVI
jgi:Transposase